MSVVKCRACGRAVPVPDADKLRGQIIQQIREEVRNESTGQLAKRNAIRAADLLPLNATDHRTVLMILEAFSNKQIAAVLRTSESVVANRVSRIFKSVGCYDRAELITKLAFGV